MAAYNADGDASLYHYDFHSMLPILRTSYAGKRDTRCNALYAYV